MYSNLNDRVAHSTRAETALATKLARLRSETPTYTHSSLPCNNVPSREPRPLSLCVFSPRWSWRPHPRIDWLFLPLSSSYGLCWYSKKAKDETSTVVHHRPGKQSLLVQEQTGRYMQGFRGSFLLLNHASRGAGAGAGPGVNSKSCVPNPQIRDAARAGVVLVCESTGSEADHLGAHQRRP
jgi:hypothetical protein